MNKTIIININGIVFHIEEEAYEVLRKYMIEIKRHFGKTPENQEILEDIEMRIAEMFSERIEKGRKEVVTMEDVEQVINQMGRVSDFEENSFESEEESAKETGYESEEEVVNKKLMRDPDDRLLGGVCSGLAHYFAVDPLWTRLILLVFVLLGGSGVLVYLILWIVVPKAITRSDKMAMRGQPANLQTFKESFQKEMDGVKESFSENSEQFERSSRYAGSVLLRIIKAVVRIVFVCVIAVIVLLLITLLIALCVGILGIFGLVGTSAIEPLNYLDPREAIWGFVAGTMVVFIPLFGLLLLFMRLVFKQKPVSNYLSLTLFSIWVISVIGVSYIAISNAQDFVETGAIKVEKELQEHEKFYLLQRNSKVIEAQSSADGDRLINIKTGDLEALLHAKIGIRFETLDSGKTPYVQYNYSAQGKNYEIAANRASKIKYHLTQDSDRLIFDSHFSLDKNTLERNQRVDLIVYLAEGTQVNISKELRSKLRGISYSACEPEEASNRTKSTDWVMGPYGLICLEKQDVDAEGGVETEAEVN